MIWNLTRGPKVVIFSGEMDISLKTEHYQTLSFPCEIFCFKPVFGACSYAVSHSGFIYVYYVS